MLRWIICGFGVLTGITYVLLYFEIKRAPEMYYDKLGNLRKVDWFEKNNETPKMFYDEYGTEPYDYEYMRSLKEGSSKNRIMGILLEI